MLNERDNSVVKTLVPEAIVDALHEIAGVIARAAADIASHYSDALLPMSRRHG